MKAIQTISWLTFIIILLVSCDNTLPKTEDQDSLTQSEIKENVSFTANYVTDSYRKRSEGYDWVAVIVKQKTVDELKVRVRSRADKKRPTCTFDANIFRFNDSIFQTTFQGKDILFTFGEKTLSIDTRNPEERDILFYFCSGGASLEGVYTKIDEPLDREQIDRSLFNKVLNLQNIGFDITTVMDGENKVLTIQPFGLSINNKPANHTIIGDVTDAEIEDLNMDGFPEVVVYISAGKDARGTVIGYSVNNGKSMSMIAFPDMANKPGLNEGYAGFDEFALVETSLVRRFPLYQDGEATGKFRQIQYKVEEGEALRQFVVDKVIEYPAE